MRVLVLVTLSLSYWTTSIAFTVPPPAHRCKAFSSTTTTTLWAQPPLLDRRSFAKKNSVGAAALLLFGWLQQQTPPALASGGATAGGAYLLSAKQRYNARVVAGMKGFLSLESSLTEGSLVETKEYFQKDDGVWADVSAAGYLLANAFRRNSTTPPDNLPAVKVKKDSLLVKTTTWDVFSCCCCCLVVNCVSLFLSLFSLSHTQKWKAFAGQVEAMQKASKRNDSKGTLAAYQKALPALDDYLGEVELPPAPEL